MKKIMALLLAGLMIVALSVPVFAAGSASAKGTITGADGGVLTDVKGTLPDGASDMVGLLVNGKNVSVKLYMTGATSAMSGYVTVNGVKVAATFGNGYVTFTAPESGTVAVFITSSGKSPKTGTDGMALYLGMIGMMALAGAAVVYKKKAA